MVESEVGGLMGDNGSQLISAQALHDCPTDHDVMGRCVCKGEIVVDVNHAGGPGLSRDPLSDWVRRQQRSDFHLVLFQLLGGYDNAKANETKNSQREPSCD